MAFENPNAKGEEKITFLLMGLGVEWEPSPRQAKSIRESVVGEKGRWTKDMEVNCAFRDEGDVFQRRNPNNPVEQWY